MDLLEVGGPKSQALINCKYATSKNWTVVDPTAYNVLMEWRIEMINGFNLYAG